MSLIIYAGNAGDRSGRGMQGAVSLGQRIAADLDVQPTIVGAATEVVEGGWRAQLDAATPNMRLLSAALADRLDAGDRPILTTCRCAASIATLPMVASRFPDAAIVWFDAHGNSNVPKATDGSEPSYLGGMVLSGAAGEWATGFGARLDMANVILVGARDLDPPERKRIEAGELQLVAVGPDLGDRVTKAIDGRSVYIHLDCDVMDAGLLATEYQCPGGLSFRDLHEAFEALSSHDLLGLEIAEYDDRWPNGSLSRAKDLIQAVRPVLERLGSRVLS